MTRVEVAALVETLRARGLPGLETDCADALEALVRERDEARSAAQDALEHVDAGNMLVNESLDSAIALAKDRDAWRARAVRLAKAVRAWGHGRPPEAVGAALCEIEVAERDARSIEEAEVGEHGLVGSGTVGPSLNDRLNAAPAERDALAAQVAVLRETLEQVWAAMGDALCSGNGISREYGMAVMAQTMKALKFAEPASRAHDAAVREQAIEECARTAYDMLGLTTVAATPGAVYDAIRALAGRGKK